MPKPKWGDAPDWASWLVRDRRGDWYWCRYEPEVSEDLRDWAVYGKTEFAIEDKTPKGSWEESLERRPTSGEDPTPFYYNNEYKGIKLDVYRMAEVLSITHPCQQHIFKKSARMHKENHKTLEENLDDIIKTCQRWKEMIKEDNGE